MHGDRMSVGLSFEARLHHRRRNRGQPAEIPLSPLKDRAGATGESCSGSQEGEGPFPSVWPHYQARRLGIRQPAQKEQSQASQAIPWLLW